jgi:hypothetical protein
MPVFARSAVSADGDSAGDRFRVSGGLDSDERSGERLSEYRGRLPCLRHFWDGTRFHPG